MSALLLQNLSYWHIQDLEITGGTMYGLHITSNTGAGTLTHFRLSDMTGHPILLSFLDPTEDAARSQLVFLCSMVQQFSAQGVKLVVVIPRSSASQDELANFIHAWGLESIPVLVDHGETMQYYAVSHIPVTFLIGFHDQLLQRWDGLALPYPLILGLSSLLHNLRRN